MKFPFDNESVQELTGKPLVLSSNLVCSNEFRTIQEVSLLPDGKIAGSKGNWEVVDGVLRLLDDRGHLVTEFRAIETRNGAVYAVGRNVMEVGDVPRPILHVKKPVGIGLGICISSHTAYEKIAVPRIIRSLEGDGFDMSRVVVVIGNDGKKDGQHGFDPELKAMVVRRRQVVFGLTALTHVPDMAVQPYWLLLHDTCEVANGFTDSIMDVDVGLNPDVVTLRPLDEKVELGLYSSSFAGQMRDMPIDAKPYDYFKITTSRAGLISVLKSPVKTEPERDVYGRGIKRETVSYPALGIRKYRAKALDVNKP